MKRFLALILAGMMTLTLVACGNTDTSTDSGDSGESQGDATETTTLKFNLVKSTTDPQYEWYGRFWEDVNEATGVKWKAKSTPVRAWA